MAKDLQKTAKPATPTKPTPAPDAASRLKRQLMSDAVGGMFGRVDVNPTASGPAYVLLGIANRDSSPVWEQWKARQREMFAATGLHMKLGFYGADDAHGVRSCRISSKWYGDADAMDGHIDRAREQCACGCFVFARTMLQQAVKENTKQPLRAVIFDGDMLHDTQEDLDEAAIAINQLRRKGTRVFLFQQGNNPDTTRRMQYLARVAGASYFKFDEHQQQQYAELLNLVSIYATGGEAAVEAKGGQMATLLLEHLKQEPMPIIEARKRARVKAGLDSQGWAE